VDWLMRVATGSAVIAIALSVAAAPAAAFIHSLFIPTVVVLLLAIIFRLIWWYTTWR